MVNAVPSSLCSALPRLKRMFFLAWNPVIEALLSPLRWDIDNIFASLPLRSTWRTPGNKTNNRPCELIWWQAKCERWAVERRVTSCKPWQMTEWWLSHSAARHCPRWVGGQGLRSSIREQRCRTQARGEECEIPSTLLYRALFSRRVLYVTHIIGSKQLHTRFMWQSVFWMWYRLNTGSAVIAHHQVFICVSCAFARNCHFSSLGEFPHPCVHM